jgi:hypothetical protein
MFESEKITSFDVPLYDLIAVPVNKILSLAVLKIRFDVLNGSFMTGLHEQNKPVNKIMNNIKLILVLIRQDLIIRG